ncbi:MAG: hypothetical protein QXR63_05670 [Candidatus Bathyarchaeia archaeon]
MYNSISNLDAIVKTVSGTSTLPIEIMHKITFCSFAKAGLSLYGATSQQETEIEKLIQTIPASHRALTNGKLYLNALNFVKSFNKFLKKPDESVILKEANIHYILDFLKDRVGKVGAIVVLDCGSIPEIITMAGKFTTLNHNTAIFDQAFINPVGATSFVTGQMPSFGREAFLMQYAQLLKETLEAKFYIKSSTIDLITHQQGVTIDNFLTLLNIQNIFDQINHFAKQNSVLITSDHGYDLVADEHGLYITHGYKKECPLNFSKIALFMVVD